MDRLERAGGRRHRRGERHRPGQRAPATTSEGARVVVADLNADAGKRTARTRRPAFSWPRIVTDPGAAWTGCSLLRTTRTARWDIAFNNAADLPARRRLHPGHRPRRVAQGPGGQLRRRSTCAARRPSCTCGPRWGKGRSSTPPRSSPSWARRPRRSPTPRPRAASLSMSRELGACSSRSARASASTRFRSGPGQHPAAPGTVRQGRRARPAPPRARAHGLLRRAGRDRGRGRVPRQRRPPPSPITASTFLVDGGISGAYVTPLYRLLLHFQGGGEEDGAGAGRAPGRARAGWPPSRAGPRGLCGSSRRARPGRSQSVPCR